jgi:uncharacterized protein (TIGR00661 family)
MRILYGIQGTGNGHISRSREILHHLEALGHDVQVLISGRASGAAPVLELKRPLLTRHGLTFRTQGGQIQLWESARDLHVLRAWNELNELDQLIPTPDLVITDFEPLSAWWARRRGLRCLGIGHQYSFLKRVPCPRGHWGSRLVLRRFAPCDVALGLHWDSFGQAILPPVIPALPEAAETRRENEVLVYLPFESQAAIEAFLRPLDHLHFLIYGHPDVRHMSTSDHLSWRPFDRQAFLTDLSRSAGIICSAGFELPSEAAHLGCRILVKPLSGQLEQLANAQALVELGLGQSLTQLDPQRVPAWLEAPAPRARRWPNVAQHIANWIHQGDLQGVPELARSLWSEMV